MSFSPPQEHTITFDFQSFSRTRPAETRSQSFTGTIEELRQRVASLRQQVKNAEFVGIGSVPVSRTVRSRLEGSQMALEQLESNLNISEPEVEDMPVQQQDQRTSSLLPLAVLGGLILLG